MKIMNKIINIIDTVTDRTGKVCAYSCIPLMIVIVMEVIRRRILNSPTIWAYEIITMLYGFFFMMSLAYGMLKGSMVSIDLLTQFIKSKALYVLNLVGYIIFFFPFVTFVVPVAWDSFMHSFMIKEASWSAWGPPVYHLRFIIPVAFSLVWLQGISSFLKNIISLKDDNNNQGLVTDNIATEVRIK